MLKNIYLQLYLRSREIYLQKKLKLLLLLRDKFKDRKINCANLN